jgi:hypothetical protein
MPPGRGEVARRDEGTGVVIGRASDRRRKGPGTISGSRRATAPPWGPARASPDPPTCRLAGRRSKDPSGPPRPWTPRRPPSRRRSCRSRRPPPGATRRAAPSRRRVLGGRGAVGNASCWSCPRLSVPSRAAARRATAPGTDDSRGRRAGGATASRRRRHAAPAPPGMVSSFQARRARQPCRAARRISKGGQARGGAGLRVSAHKGPGAGSPVSPGPSGRVTSRRAIRPSVPGPGRPRSSAAPCPRRGPRRSTRRPRRPRRRACRRG